MAIGPRRPQQGNQPRAQRTRQAVIDETVRYILDEGFAAPSVRRITKRAGVTWGVVQYHFGDLGGLLMAVVDQGISELINVLDGLPAGTAGLPLEQRTRLLLDAAWEAFSSPTSLAALEILISTRAIRDDTVSKQLAEVMYQLTELGGHLGEGLDPRRGREIGNLIWANLRGLVVAQLVSPVPLETAKDHDVLAAVLVAYIESHA
jgi:AcrR family transcriptional regulator